MKERGAAEPRVGITKGEAGRLLGSMIGTVLAAA
jgi:hypothetical protein